MLTLGLSHFCACAWHYLGEDCRDEYAKIVSLPYFLYAKCIILPRQARDKHRESTHKKETCVFRRGQQRALGWQLRLADGSLCLSAERAGHGAHATAAPVPPLLELRERCEKRPLLSLNFPRQARVRRQENCPSQGVVVFRRAFPFQPAGGNQPLPASWRPADPSGDACTAQTGHLST